MSEQAAHAMVSLSNLRHRCRGNQHAVLQILIVVVPYADSIRFEGSRLRIHDLPSLLIHA